jgi:hypothetical protein
MVDFLANEDQYWMDTLNDPTSWDERKTSTVKAKMAHLKTRTSAANWCGKSAGRRGSQSTTTIPTTTTKSSPPFFDDSLDFLEDESDVINLVDQPFPPHLASRPIVPVMATPGLLLLMCKTENFL